jgi:hypothetical protein
MSSQLTRNELLALVSLAAGVGPALQDPQQGLLPPLIIAVWVAAMQRAMAYLSVLSRRFDSAGSSAAARHAPQCRLARVRARRAARAGCLAARLRRADVLGGGRIFVAVFTAERTGGQHDLRRRDSAQGCLSVLSR